MIERSTRLLAFLVVLLWIGNTCYAWENGVDIHGFISQGYLQTTKNNYIADSTDGTFQFNEMAINFNNQPMDKLRIGVQLFAKDFGDVGNDEITVDYAFADYRVTDYFGIRAGRMKNPMGLYSEYRDVDMLRTCILLPYSVYDENLREAQNFIKGISFYGDINMATAGSLSYQALVGTNNIPTGSATAMFLEIGVMNAESIDLDTALSYALQYSDPTGHVRLGATAYFCNIEMAAKSNGEGFYPVEGVDFQVNFDDIEIYTASFEFIYGNFLFASELKNSRVSDAVYTIVESNYAAQILPVDMFGGYGLISYRFNDYLEMGLYYDHYHFDRHDRHGDNPQISFHKHYYWSKKWVYSCKIDINANWLLKLETHYTDGTGSIPAVYNPSDTPGDVNPDTERHWMLYAAKLSYNF